MKKIGGVEICPECWRTDAFKPGVIDHDNETHAYLKWAVDHPRLKNHQKLDVIIINLK